MVVSILVMVVVATVVVRLVVEALAVKSTAGDLFNSCRKRSATSV
jgi:hypothetical protein